MASGKQSDPFYHSAAWKRVRAMALARDNGMCQRCLEAFERGETRGVRVATTVHHIIPRTERPDLALTLDNLQSICAVCHNQAHPDRAAKTKPAPPKPDTRGVKIIKL